jgi:hypothetical protein
MGEPLSLIRDIVSDEVSEVRQPPVTHPAAAAPVGMAGPVARQHHDHGTFFAGGNLFPL